MEIKPIEWLDFKIGRQQISYGDARVLGPGQWGNTGRYAWDAIVAIINNQYIKTHLWVGRYLIRDPNKWPNPSTHYPTAYVIYSTIKRLPFNLDLFYVLKMDCRKIKQGEAGKGIWKDEFFGWMNLRDYEIDLEIKPHPSLLIKIAYHYFTLDEKKDAWYFPDGKPQRWDKTGNSGKAIGHEIDTEAIFRYQRYEWRMGLSTFIPLNFAKNTGPSPHAYWYFLQMMIWFGDFRK